MLEHSGGVTAGIIVGVLALLVVTMVATRRHHRCHPPAPQRSESSQAPGDNPISASLRELDRDDYVAGGLFAFKQMHEYDYIANSDLPGRAGLAINGTATLASLLTRLSRLGSI